MTSRTSFIKSLFLFTLMSFSLGASASDYREGKIYFGVRDMIDGSHSNFIDFKEEATGKVYSLGFKGSKVPEEVKKLKSGQMVRIKASVINSKLGQLGYENMDHAYQAPMEDVYSVPRVNGAQERNALVVRVNLKDEGQLSCNSEADLEERIFSLSNPSSGANVYKAMSAGQFKFTGRVVTIDLNKYTSDYSTCSNMELHELADAAEDELLRQGIDPRDYNYQQYYIPSSIPCSFGGWAWASANLGFVRTCSDKTPIHEFGHNFGMQHAADSSYEYGDYSDFMGIQYRELNAPHRDQLGWMNDNELKTINASTKETFRLYALNTDDESALKALKFARSSKDDHMYFSYRTKTGPWDQGLSSVYADKLNIHKAEDRDMFRDYHNKTYFVDALSPGGTYTDSVTGISVKVVSKTSTYMDISINGGTGTTPPPSCQEVDPSISISSTYLEVEKGKTGQRAFTVKNNNNSYCQTKTYNLSVQDLSGIDGSLNKTSVSLDSGASATVYVSANVSGSKAVGSYQLPLKAISSSSSSSVATSSFRVKVIEPADTIKPSVSLTSPANGAEYKEGASVTINASASDNVGVASVKFYLDGAYVGVDSTSPYTYQFTMPKSTGLSLKAVAQDAAGNLGESSVIQIKNPEEVDQSPSVTMVSPASDITVNVNQKVTLSAKITDDKGINTVYFYSQFGWRRCQMGYNCEKDGDVYSMQTSFSAAGTYRVTAFAYDTGSNGVIASGRRLITAVSSTDTIAPTISINDRKDGDSFYKDSRLSVTMSASDNVGVSKVELYLGSELKCENASASYTCSITVPEGDFTLTAKAYDAAGNMGEASVKLVGKAQANQKPVISFISPSSNSVDLKAGDTLKLSAKITDDSAVKYVYYYTAYGWKRCELGINCVKEGDIYTMEIKYSEAGTFATRIFVYDDASAYSMSARIVVNVSEAVEPSEPISIVSPSNGEAFAIGDEVTVKAKVASEIDIRAVYIWSSKGYWRSATLGADGLYSYSFQMNSSLNRVRSLVYKTDGSYVLSDFVEVKLK